MRHLREFAAALSKHLQAYFSLPLKTPGFTEQQKKFTGFTGVFSSSGWILTSSG